MEKHKDILIGTLVNANKGVEKTVSYIRQIKSHGFESFSLTFWQTLGTTDIIKLADAVMEELDNSGAVISSVCIYGNPLEHSEKDGETRKAWETIINNIHLFKTDIVGGFAGRLTDKPIDESLPRYKEVFGELARMAADKGVRLAFENCDMGGSWDKGNWNIAQTPAIWEKMFNEIPSANVGLQWEPCHQMVKLIDPMPQLRKWVSKIFHVHGKDASIHWDVIREYGITGAKKFAFHRTPGFGDSNWTDIISELRRGGFKGAIDIEGWHDPVYRDSLEMTGQVHALNYLKKCRGGDFIENPRE